MATSKNINNPFSIASYLGAEYFCDRQQETKNLHDALLNGRNVTLISPRRMGKTGLIRHLFAQIPAKEAYCFYVDIYNTTNLHDFTKAFAEAVLTRRITPFSEHIWKEVSQLFGAIRPVFSPDPLTGMMKCTIDIQPTKEETTLQQVFAYLEQADKPCYVAFDEFQTIADYADSKVEATLRSHIQHLTNVHFIFSGSKKHTITQMFTAAGRPFFQSTQLMNIDTIEESAYYSFASKHFQAHAQRIDINTFHDLYGLVNGHTWYMQALLNRLYQNNISEIGYNDILLTLNQLLEELEPSYQIYSHLLTEKQLAIMRAIAKEGEVKEPGSNDFLQKYHLGAYSTVYSALSVLTNRELLYRQDDGSYCVYDRFFGLWLRR